MSTPIPEPKRTGLKAKWKALSRGKKILIIVVAVLLLLGFLGSLAPDDPDAATTAKETTTTETTTAEATPTEEPATEEPAPAEPEGPEEPAAGEQDPGKAFEDWYLGFYDGMTWDEIGQKYNNVWLTHIVAVGSNPGGDTLIFVTNLDRDNPDAKELAEGGVTQMQNVVRDPISELPAVVRDNLKYIQVHDMQGNPIAAGSLDFD